MENMQLELIRRDYYGTDLNVLIRIVYNTCPFSNRIVMFFCF